MNILVVIEHSHGSIHRLSKEAIVGAQNLANKVTALVIGEGSEETISFLKACDIERVLTVDHRLKWNYYQKVKLDFLTLGVLLDLKFRD